MLIFSSISQITFSVQYSTPISNNGRNRKWEGIWWTSRENIKKVGENDLYIKLEKCRWKVREMEFLEVVIGLKEIKIEEVKVKVVLDWPAPKMVKNVQKFLGLTNYYRRFMKEFVKIVRPLHKLTKKKYYIINETSHFLCINQVF